MKKLLIALLVTAIATPALAGHPMPPPHMMMHMHHMMHMVPPPPPPPPPAPPPVAAPAAPASPQVGGGTVAGHGASPALAWGAGTIIGVAAFLSGYDIWRRLNCVDPLRLGGPGYTEPLSPTANILHNPRCYVKKVRHRRAISVRG